MTLTDRTLQTTADLNGLCFDDKGLIPVVTQDASDHQVLMVAWANKESLGLTLETGFMHYWSRSRNSLWKKGETSGNTQRVQSLHADCDADTILARVEMKGPACHTGERTCFGEDSGPISVHAGSEAAASHGPQEILSILWKTLEARQRDRPEGSYTTRLLSDENLRLKKLGEELVEVVTAITRGHDSVPDEAADLVYHLMVALLSSGHSWADVEERLRDRMG